MSKGFNESKLAIANQIRDQLREGRVRGAGFMLRLKNTNTEEEFIHYLPPSANPRQAFQDYCTKNGHHFLPVECYDFQIDLEAQVQADSTQNWDRNLPAQTGPITGVVPGPIGNEGPSMPDSDPDDFR